ncbi:MAG: hypothetical protein ACLGSH_18300 [Acidobacteriota bacterium]
MNMGLVNLAALKPWWLRLLILLLIGHPLVTSPVLHSQLHKAHFYKDLGLWTAYTVFLWLIIGLCVGLKTLVDWVTVASMSALTVLLTGAIFRKLGLWIWLQSFYPSTHATDPTQNLMDLIFRFIMISASAPFALLLINSFPAADLMRWVSKRSASSATMAALICAIFLRMLQHVGEVVTRCMLAWREENPQVVLPRFSADWAGSIFLRIGFFEWIKIAVVAWCGTIAMHTLAAVPTVVADFRRVQRGAGIE